MGHRIDFDGAVSKTKYNYRQAFVRDSRAAHRNRVLVDPQPVRVVEIREVPEIVAQRFTLRNSHQPGSESENKPADDSKYKHIAE